MHITGTQLKLQTLGEQSVCGQLRRPGGNGYAFKYDILGNIKGEHGICVGNTTVCVLHNGKHTVFFGNGEVFQIAFHRKISRRNDLKIRGIDLDVQGMDGRIHRVRFDFTQDRILPAANQRKDQKKGQKKRKYLFHRKHLALLSL